MSNSLIWVLKDERPGNYSQAIGLAENLNRPFLIKKIEFNFLSKLPNFFKIDRLIGVKKSFKKDLLNQKDPPKIVISTGRKTAPIALFLKENYQCFIIQIMKPDISLGKFDLVIVPKHDLVSDQKNILNSIGALNRITDELLEKEYQKFADILGKINPPKIALLVGGSSKKGNFNEEITLELARICKELAKNMNATLLVTTSKRTSEETIQILENSLPKNSFFFKWQEGKDNPYFAMLKAANYIIVTGDSMSMCSESCSSGRPVYIFNPEEICSKKHLRLHENLFFNNFAKQLKSNLLILENYKANKLNETNRISKEIEKILSSKNL